MPGCGEEDDCLGRGGSLEDGDLYLCWNNCPGLAVVTCHHFTSIHRKLSQLAGIQFHSGKAGICRCQRVISQSEPGPHAGHGRQRLTCCPSTSLLRQAVHQCRGQTLPLHASPCTLEPWTPVSPPPGGDTEWQWRGGWTWCVPGEPCCSCAGLARSAAVWGRKGTCNVSWAST